MSTPHPEPVNSHPILIPDGSAVSFNPQAFEDFISSQGILLEHWAGQRCPVGLVDQDDMTRRPHEDHEGCSNGFIYTLQGDVVCLFVSNALKNQASDTGRMDEAGAQVTLPTYYTSTPCGTANKPVMVAPFDRFYLKEDAGLEVVHWQLHRAHETGDERLNFPVKQMGEIIDSRGKRYDSSTYVITKDGHVRWIKNGPEPGLVLSLRYQYRAYWFVQKLIHEIRVSQVEDGLGNRVVRRSPQTAVLQREYVFMNQGSELTKDASNARQPRSPQNGSFGPR
jgi:hypothetical protein